MKNELQQAELMGANARINNIKAAAQSVEFMSFLTKLFAENVKVNTIAFLDAFNKGWHTKHNELTNLELQ